MTMTTAEALALRYGADPPLEVLAVFGEWVVAADGLYCLTQTYDIPRAALAHDFWPSFMAEKRWCNLTDFRAAYGFAVTEPTSAPVPA